MRQEYKRKQNRGQEHLEGVEPAAEGQVFYFDPSYVLENDVGSFAK